MQAIWSWYCCPVMSSPTMNVEKLFPLSNVNIWSCLFSYSEEFLTSVSRGDRRPLSLSWTCSLMWRRPCYKNNMSLSIKNITVRQLWEQGQNSIAIPYSCWRTYFFRYILCRNCNRHQHHLHCYLHCFIIIVIAIVVIIGKLKGNTGALRWVCFQRLPSQSLLLGTLN